MSDINRQAHWRDAYASKGERDVSWFQETPAPSLDLIALTGAAPDAAIIDVGGGASRLVDHLIARGFADVTVLDLSDAALAAARKRLGDAASGVRWIEADVTQWESDRAFDLWHDRAALHFLTAAEDRIAYVARLRRALKPGGHAIIGTFAIDGPERCSGLPVMRYDTAGLRELLGGGFALVDARRHEHRTPWGATQRFQFSTFRKA